MEPRFDKIKQSSYVSGGVSVLATPLWALIMTVRADIRQRGQLQLAIRREVSNGTHYAIHLAELS